MKDLSQVTNLSQQVKENDVATKIAIYTRNVSSELVEGGHRLHHDIQILKERYGRAGYDITRIYSDSSCYGNTVSGRPALQQLLQDAKKGYFNVVLVWEVFYLAAKGEDLLFIERKLRDHDIELCSVTEIFETDTVMGLEHFRIMASLLEHEYLTCKRDIPLSSLARLIMTNGQSMKGGEFYA
ncbi:recombinase family protein [Sediminibacillus halophilus]|uniref:Resolvase, N terminal domain n=1 Tax=Sediminibacillus halophilus TaxID=482461 RepID=A0A1G9T531_9BACI|nr:recombinase family protein [Sediminibacillus halophilus]SDM42809.1 Resolvase, N terminal domain [Sediminibacillus halophilus]